MSPATPSEILERINRELTRTAVRARNGLKHVSGVPLGKVGASAKTLVWERDKVTLFRYDSESRGQGPPVMLVMSLVTRSYVFDLRPGGSLVEDMLASGFDVYLLDWGVPDVSDSGNSLETYCDEYIPHATAAVLHESGARQVSLLGYCLGAALCLIAVAGNPQLPVRNIVALATPVDFQQFGPITQLLREGRVEPKAMLDETGNVPASVTLSALRMLKPTTPLATYASLWQGLSDEESLAAHQAIIGWSTDHIPFPGAAFLQIVDLFVRGAALVSGKVPMGGRIVELATIGCPVLSVVGERDQLVPPQCTEPLGRALGPVELETLVLRAGHAGLFVGKQARNQCVPSIVDWLNQDLTRGSDD